MTTGREAFFEVARSEGAKYLFTNPGTTELPIFDELAEDPGIELIFCLFEGVAVGAADAYAAATGRPSLVNLHIAPGLANGLCGMYNARWARSPVVMTAGQQDTRNLVSDPMLAGDLCAMAAPFSKWTYECRRPEEVGTAMRRAFQFAASPPQGPTFVSIPWDVFDQDADFQTPGPSPIERAPGAPAGAIEQTAKALLEAERPLIVAGDGVARSPGAIAELVTLAETLGAKVAAEPIAGRLVFPWDHPLWAGTMVPMNAGIRSTMEQADVALVVGSVAFATLYPSPVAAIPPDVRVIQIDSDAYEIAKTYPVELGMIADPKQALASLNAVLAKRITPAHTKAAERRAAEFQQQREAAMGGLNAALEAKREQTPIAPIVACAEIANAIEPGTCVVDESVTSTIALRTCLKLSEPSTYFFTRGGGLGYGLPASIGVKLARPDRPVLAVVGDGTTLYTPQALWTMAHHNLPIVAVVLNNASYLILKTGLRTMAGKAAKNDVWPAMDIVDPRVDFASLAATFGVASDRVEKAGDIGPAIRKAFASGAPTLIEVIVEG